MSVIMGYIELLSDEEQFGLFPPEKQLSFLKEAYRKGEALSRIIDDLFDISRIEAGIPLPIEKSNCDVNETLQKVVEHFAKDNKKHPFSCDYATEATALLDRNKLTQVFVNLISNAVKYSPAGGTIKIRTAVEDRMLYVDIVDNGVGMSADQLERVFDKFYRADSSDTAISGLGLGMSIVKTIIEAHDGQISITSTQGVGTHVSLTFPVS